MKTRGASSEVKNRGGKDRGRMPGSAKSQRQLARQQKERRRRIMLIGAAVLGVAILAGIVYAIMTPEENVPAAVGQSSEQAVEVMADTKHYPEGSKLTHNSNPPSSGPHYGSEYDPGFYDEEKAASLPKEPEGYLVHNLEHGYVIFWYNCDLLDGAGCDTLKSQIQDVMKQAGNLKVIGFPWPGLQKPVVMTSWGRMIEFDAFDSAAALDYVKRNRNKAPEPNAP